MTQISLEQIAERFLPELAFALKAEERTEKRAKETVYVVDRENIVKTDFYKQFSHSLLHSASFLTPLFNLYTTVLQCKFDFVLNNLRTFEGDMYFVREYTQDGYYIETSENETSEKLKFISTVYEVDFERLSENRMLLSYGRVGETKISQSLQFLSFNLFFNQGFINCRENGFLEHATALLLQNQLTTKLKSLGYAKTDVFIPAKLDRYSLPKEFIFSSLRFHEK